MDFIKHRKIYYIFSGLLVAISIVSFFTWKLNLGIEFTGGSLLEVEFKNQSPSINEIKDSLKELDLGDINIQPSGENRAIIRLKEIDDDTHKNIIGKLNNLNGGAEEKRFELIGSVIGSELKNKSFWAVGIVLVLIVIYIAFAFRKISFRLASWKYGVAAMIALLHDVLITVGAFSILGHFLNIEVGVPFIAAILTILGYSVNDTIVVFDRTRENLLKYYEGDLENTLNKSLNQTLSRSINTSLTTLLVLVAIFLVGGESIKYFALTLIIGISIGTYSSIFIASPILFTWERGKRA